MHTHTKYESHPCVQGKMHTVLVCYVVMTFFKKHTEKLKKEWELKFTSNMVMVALKKMVRCLADFQSDEIFKTAS